MDQRALAESVGNCLAQRLGPSITTSSVKRARRSLVTQAPLTAASAPDQVWCIDFKGWFRTGDGQRCDPLTVSDAFG
jgi:putative transposase